MAERRPEENDKEQIPVVRVDSPSAEAFADLISLDRDLCFVIECCDRLVSMLGLEKRDATVVRALFSSALIAYVRCWSTGTRSGLTEGLLESFEGAPERFHQFLKDLRDIHVGHAVDPFERAVVGVAIAQDADGYPDSVVAQLTHELVTLEAEFLRSFRSLAAQLADRVWARRKELEATVRREAGTEGVEALLRRPPLGLVIPGVEHTAQSRTIAIARADLN